MTPTTPKRPPQSDADHAPFVLRGGNNDPEWYCIVAGRTFGPWADKGGAAAGFATEKRRAAKRQQRPSS